MVQAQIYHAQQQAAAAHQAQEAQRAQQGGLMGPPLLPAHHQQPMPQPMQGVSHGMPYAQVCSPVLPSKEGIGYNHAGRQPRNAYAQVCSPVLPSKEGIGYNQFAPQVIPSNPFFA